MTDQEKLDNESVVAFREQVTADYQRAIVRLATLRADGQHHLLFGWVELFPHDMNVPDGWNGGQKPWPVPGQSEWTLGFTASNVTVEAALDWYESAAVGMIAIGKNRPVVVGPLGAEPGYGQFCTGVDFPFAFRWHDGPRVHRYVPLAPSNSSMRELSRSTPAREWLEMHLGFDPFRYEEWLGGLALVAPDPVCSSVSVFPSARAEDGSESLTVHAVPRRWATGAIADLSTLSIHLAERRVDGWSAVHIIPFDATGHATIVNPQPCNKIGHAVVCSRRGLLRMVEPLNWVEQISVGMNIARSKLRIEVPAGGRRKPGKTVDVHRFDKGPGLLVGKPLNEPVRLRLVTLQERRKARERRAEAQQRVFGIAVDKASLTEDEIKAKRKEAEDFVSGLVRGARKRLLFVDPFFGCREMRLFALLASIHGVIPCVITGLPGLEADAAGTPDQPIAAGDVMVADLEHIARQPNVKAPHVRVMPGSDKPVIHDRYLVVDDQVWHCGPSFNELGERLGVIVQLPDPLSVRRALSKVWVRSRPLAEFWRDHRSSSNGQP